MFNHRKELCVLVGVNTFGNATYWTPKTVPGAHRKDGALVEFHRINCPHSSASHVHAEHRRSRELQIKYGCLNGLGVG